jgi:predicted tellurium resistance membrane protein TerC
MSTDRTKRKRLRNGIASALVLLVMMILVGYQMLVNWNGMDLPAQIVFLAWLAIAVFLFSRSLKRLAALFADMVPPEQAAADRYRAQNDDADPKA